jgi:hypothetical protein
LDAGFLSAGFRVVVLAAVFLAAGFEVDFLVVAIVF